MFFKDAVEILPSFDKEPAEKQLKWVSPDEPLEMEEESSFWIEIKDGGVIDFSN